MDSSQPLQQGYLQFAQSGECRKVFARVNQNSITLLSDDPTKVADAHLIASFDLHKTNLIEQGDFQRPKSFGLLVSGTGLVEFSCPTNSVRSAWIKTIQQAILFGNKFSVTKSLSLDIPSPDSNILMRTPMSYNPANSMPYSHSNAASCAQRLADSRATASQILQHPSHYPMACPSSSVANMSRNTSPVRLQNVPHSTLGQQQPQQNAQQQQQQQPLKFRSRAAAVATSSSRLVGGMSRPPSPSRTPPPSSYAANLYQHNPSRPSPRSSSAPGSPGYACTYNFLRSPPEAVGLTSCHHMVQPHTYTTRDMYSSFGGHPYQPQLPQHGYSFGFPPPQQIPAYPSYNPAMNMGYPSRQSSDEYDDSPNHPLLHAPSFPSSYPHQPPTYHTSMPYAPCMIHPSAPPGPGLPAEVPNGRSIIDNMTIGQLREALQSLPRDLLLALLGFNASDEHVGDRAQERRHKGKEPEKVKRTSKQRHRHSEKEERGKAYSAIAAAHGAVNENKHSSSGYGNAVNDALSPMPEQMQQLIVLSPEYKSPIFEEEYYELTDLNSSNKEEEHREQHIRIEDNSYQEEVVPRGNRDHGTESEDDEEYEEDEFERDIDR